VFTEETNPTRFAGLC